MPAWDDTTTHNFYTRFYEAAPHSQANASYCKRVYGRDLCQHGFADMAQVDQLIAVCDLGSANRVLELGCGTGQIAEYLSDKTGAYVYGIDLIPTAVDLATARTTPKRDRLTFGMGNIHALDITPGEFDTVIAIDTLYYGDLMPLIATLKAVIQPGGQIAAYYGMTLFDGADDPLLIRVNHTPLAQALATANLTYQAWDYTQAERKRAEIARQAAEDLKATFEAEGNLFLYQNRIDEANGSIRFIDEGRSCRYLYHVTLPVE